MKEVIKPITMRRDELVAKIAAAVNESGLSCFVLDYIFRDILNEIHTGVVAQAQKEKDDYIKAIKADNSANAKTESADK